MIRKTSSLFVSSAIALLCAGALVVSSPAYSQKEEKELRFDKAKTTKVKAIGAKLAKQLQPARDCLSPPVDEGQPAKDPDADCAIQFLNKIRMDKLPGHEKAEVWNLFGYSYFLKEDMAGAKRSYSLVIQEPEANAPLRNRTCLLYTSDAADD